MRPRSRSSSSVGLDGLDIGQQLRGLRPAPGQWRRPAEEALEDDISEDVLRRYCYVSDLSTVEDLEIQVDSAVHNVEALGLYLPNLRRLRLSGSSVMCMRELGAALPSLEVLWMSRCGLQDLDGVTVLGSLQELYLPFNDIADLTLLKWLDSLAVLDIEGNAVSGLGDVAELRKCHQLRDVTLRGNPVCCDGGYSRDAVLEMVPQISILDEAYRDEPQAPPLTAHDPEMYLDLYLESEIDLYLDLFLDSAGPGDAGGAAGTEPGMRGAEELDPASEVGWSSETMSRGLLSGPLPPDLADAFAGEPGEQELVIEWLKRARPKQAAPQATFALTARTSPEPAGFDLRLADRRQAPRALPGGGPPAGEGDCTAASDLTRGGSLAGNPLAALRHRRSQASSSSVSRPADLSIRELLRRHRVAGAV